MTSFYLMFTSTMTSSTHLPSTSPTLTMTSKSTHDLHPNNLLSADLVSNIREFWASTPLPCPPPWNPQILRKVNTTRLSAHVENSVKAFVAGKCRVTHVFEGFPGFEDLIISFPEFGSRSNSGSGTFSGPGILSESIPEQADDPSRPGKKPMNTSSCPTEAY